MKKRNLLIQTESELIRQVCCEGAGHITLFLDSSGPALARHYLFLKALGPHSVQSFREVHCVSGGVFALVGFHAFKTAQTAYPLDRYLETFDRDYRALHHPHRLQIARYVFNLLSQKPLFDGIPVLERTLEYCFSEKMLKTSIQEFPIRFSAYLGEMRNSDLMRVNVGDPNEKKAMTLGQLLTAAIRIPSVYGKPSSNFPYYDGAFHPQYRNLLKTLEADGHRLLVSTPWRHGERRSSIFVNMFSNGNPKFRMAFDFVRLLLNIPNGTYQENLKAAFKDS